jgi:hypothetical protein
MNVTELEDRALLKELVDTVSILGTEKISMGKCSCLLKVQYQKRLLAEHPF